MRSRIAYYGIAAAVSLLFAAQPALNISYEDITSSAGITFRNVNSATPEKNLIETMTGGVAFLDFDHDGWQDLFFVNGAKLRPGQKDGEALDKSGPEFWNRLYRNNHDGTFTDVTESSGLKGIGYGMGVAVGDYDNDGYPDSTSPL